jgi:ketosteroid isomerase-like protein
MRAILFILLSFGVGCAATPGFHAEIHDANRRLESDFNRGDHPAVAEAYLDDAMLVGPGGQVVTGRGAIDAYWMRPWVDAHWDLTVRSIEGSSASPSSATTARARQSCRVSNSSSSGAATTPAATASPSTPSAARETARGIDRMFSLLHGRKPPPPPPL